LSQSFFEEIVDKDPPDFFPALRVLERIAAQFVYLSEKENADFNIVHVLCHASRDDESVSPRLFPLATENDDATRAFDGPVREESLYAVGYVAAGVLHELQARNAMPLDGEPVQLRAFRLR